MKRSTWVLALFLFIGVAGFSGCFGTDPAKPLTPEEQKKLDDDMRKIIEQNKKS